MPETAIAPGIRTVRVPDGTAGRIDRFIADATGLSRSHVQKLISDGRLTVDGVRVRANALVAPGSEVRLDVPEPIDEGPTPSDGPAPDLTTSDGGSDVGPDGPVFTCNGSLPSTTVLGSQTGNSVTSGSTAGGTSNFSASCGGGAAGPDDSFTWTAPSSGCFRIDTVGSSYDTVLHVRACSNQAELGCNDDFNFGGPEETCAGYCTLTETAAECH